MKTGWKVVGIIVAVLLLLGAVGIGVGVITGGSLERIVPVIDDALAGYGLSIDLIQGAYETALMEILPML